MPLEEAVALVETDGRHHRASVTVLDLVQREDPIVVVLDQVVAVSLAFVDQIKELLHLDAHYNIVIEAAPGTIASVRWTRAASPVRLALQYRFDLATIRIHVLDLVDGHVARFLGE